MILYRTKYYAQAVGGEVTELEINLYDAFKKAYDSSTNHPKWVEELKKRSDDYIAKEKFNPSNNLFSKWLIELSPSGKKAAEDYFKSSSALINDYIQTKLSEEDWGKLEKSFNKLLKKANEEDKERLSYIFNSEADFVKILKELEGERGIGNISFDKISDHDLAEFKELLSETVEKAERGIKNQLSTVEYKENLQNRGNIVRNILENDPISTNTENIPNSFEFRGKKVSLSEAEMGRYMKLQEIFEGNFKDAISKKNGMKKFLNNIFLLFGDSGGNQVKQLKDSILEECKKTNDPEQMLKILSDKFNLKNKEALFLRTIEELSVRNNCDSLKDLLTKATSDPKLAENMGLSSKNVNELKKVLNDDVAKSFVKKLTMADPKTLENAVINLKLTDEEITRSEQFQRLVNKGKSKQPSPDASNIGKEIIEEVEDTVKDTKTGEVKTSLWKKATKWVKENPWKSTAIGVGALSIGFAVHQCLKKKDEIREEKNRAEFDKWKNKFE